MVTVPGLGLRWEERVLSGSGDGRRRVQLLSTYKVSRCWHLQIKKYTFIRKYQGNGD